MIGNKLLYWIEQVYSHNNSTLYKLDSSNLSTIYTHTQKNLLESFIHWTTNTRLAREENQVRVPLHGLTYRKEYAYSTNYT